MSNLDKDHNFIPDIVDSYHYTALSVCTVKYNNKCFKCNKLVYISNGEIIHWVNYKGVLLKEIYDLSCYEELIKMLLE